MILVIEMETSKGRVVFGSEICDAVCDCTHPRFASAKLVWHSMRPYMGRAQSGLPERSNRVARVEK